MKRSNTYWDNRANQIIADNHISATTYLMRLNEAYKKAMAQTISDVNKIFATYANNHNLTNEQARKLLNENISNTEIRKLKHRLLKTSNEELKKQILARLNAKAYGARITRLDALQECINATFKELAGQEVKLFRSSFMKSIKSSYYRTCYEFQKGIDMAFSVASIDTRQLNMLLKAEWCGRNYSTSVWNNTNVVSKEVSKTIESSILSGKSLKTLAKDLEGLSNLGMFAAERLLRTETSYFSNQAALMGYEEVGIEKYVFVATLDGKTCSCGHKGKKSCGELDREVFHIKDKKVGINCPPMHPFCRCTVRSYISEEIYNRAQRRARDQITGKTKVVGNISYMEWRKQNVA